MGMSLTPANVASRSLYLYYNKAATITSGQARSGADVASRTLYTYYNKAATSTAGRRMSPPDVDSRSLYLFVNRAHDRTPDDVASRSLYAYVAYDSTELFPWIEKIAPVEQSRGGQVAVYGDGFGGTEAAEGGIVRLGVYDPTQLGPGAVMGVVSWSSRSPNLHPANSGLPTEPALVVTVPLDADSGMLSVEETT